MRPNLQFSADMVTYTRPGYKYTISIKRSQYDGAYITLRNIWSLIHENLRNTEAEVKKSIVKKACN